MSESTTTSNGYEIVQPVPVVSANELRQTLGREYGIEGDNPAERVEQLKQLSVEGIAIMLEDINKSVQGSADSLISHDEIVKIGGNNTIRLEDRYDVFSRLVQDIKESADDVNPERVADVLALGVVLLHPFHDGNGRTARTIGLIFREGYDNQDYYDDFNTVTEPRDRARERGGFMINGYIPQFPEGFDQSNASEASAYLSNLLLHDSPHAYTSCFGQAPLNKNIAPKT
jgi:hypothetical protein